MPTTAITTTPEELTAATADYAVPMVTRQGFTGIDPSAANALQARIADEIVALTGCGRHPAMVGAGGFVNFRNARHWGLNDGSPAGSHGLFVLGEWMAAKVAAYRAAQAQAVAA